MDQMYLVMFLREGGYIESNVDLLELDRSTLEQVIERLVDYHNSEELEDIQALRKRYGIATVPALFVSENGTAKVVCDSSLSEDDILDFIS